MGGTCLNRGCIPTKILTNASNIIDDIKSADKFGLEIERSNINYRKLIKYKNTVVENLCQGVKFLLKKNGVTIKYGVGKLVGPNIIKIKTKNGIEEIKAKNIILATGSDPIESSDIDGINIINTTSALNLDELPNSIIIVGGSASGCEFASIYNSLGVDVTIIEICDSILNISNMDADIIKTFVASFSKKGIKIITSATITSFETHKNSVIVKFNQNGSEKRIESDKVLITSGRKLLSFDLNLASVGVEVNSKNEIKVNEKFQTSIENIYAIGDVIGGPMLAHSAYAQAKAVCELILHNAHSYNPDAVPICIYTNPQISMVGLNEDEAIKKGYSIKTGLFPFKNLGIALSIDKTEGFVKIISDHEGYLLGAHIIGSHAIELIAGLTLALNIKLSRKDLTNTIYPHPTFSEAILEAVEDLSDQAIHN